MQRDPTPLTIFNLRTWLRKTAEVDEAMRREAGIASGPPSKRYASANLAHPLFVVGAPRSGTSLLGDLIGALPEFSYHYEPPITKAAARYVYEQRWGESFSRFFYKNVYRWLMRRVGELSRRYADKTPQNCFVIEFLARTFPDAQFLHIVRDGRDAALSYVEKPWLTERGKKLGQIESGGYPFGPFARFWVEPERRAEFESTSDLHRCIWAWRRHVESVLEQTARLGSSRYLEIRYEELASGPLGVATRTLDFLGITSDASRRALEAALTRVRRDSVARHERELDVTGRVVIEREAGDLLRRLGYLPATSVERGEPR